MSRTWNTRIEQNIHFPLKSYSPWSLVSSTIGLTQNFHRTVLLCWEGWDISLILFPLSCETHRQFDYNLSNNWWFVIFNFFKIMFQMSHYQWLHMVHHFNRPKLSNNSLTGDQNSNKHIANGYKKLVYTFKREAVQFFGVKNLAVNHLPLEALHAVQTWTANCKRDRKAEVTWHFAVCGLPFPMKNVMLKVSIM